MFSQFDNEEVEAYFNRLNAELKKMPPEDRAEMHQEIRQHLEALAAAHEELGATPREAAEAALRQFGDPIKIGRRLFREWKQSLPRASRGELSVILCVLMVHFSAISLMLFGGMQMTMPIYWRLFNHWVPIQLNFWVPFLAAPLLAGTVAGVLFPRRAVKASFIGHLFVPALLFIPELLSNGSGVMAGHSVGIDTAVYVPDIGIASGFSLYWEGSFIWLLLGCVSAFVIGRLRLKSSALAIIGWRTHR